MEYSVLECNFAKNKTMNKSIYNEDYRKCIELLRSKRIERGITQGQVAATLNLTQAAISKIEMCERRIDVIELRTICHTLNISFVDFINELDNTLDNHGKKEKEKEWAVD